MYAQFNRGSLPRLWPAKEAISACVHCRACQVLYIIGIMEKYAMFVGDVGERLTDPGLYGYGCDSTPIVYDKSNLAFLLQSSKIQGPGEVGAPYYS